MVFEHDGFEFEVQAHTPASLHVADNFSHSVYDIMRTEEDDQVAKIMADTGPKGALAKTGLDPAGMTVPQYRAVLLNRMDDIAETVPIPHGVPVIAGKDQWHDVVMITPKTGFYSARTGEPMDAPPLTDMHAATVAAVGDATKAKPPPKPRPGRTG